MVYTGIIYKYISPSNKIYIGLTISELLRRNEHISISYNKKSRGYNSYFHRAIRKYGIDNFIYSVEMRLSDFTPDGLKALLDFWEKYFIKLYNCKSPFGYNLTDGGDGMVGFKHSIISKLKMSVSHKNTSHSLETKIKMSLKQIGRKLSLTTKDKIRQAHLGKQRFKTRKAIIQYTIDGIVILEFDSIKQAACTLGVSASYISKALKYNTKIMNSIFKYK